jgi:hypothetical protein
MRLRYIAASPPDTGEKASVAYRLCMLFLDRWNLWSRLTRHRSWQGPNGETLDGTNNGAERAIGWWVKERYRTVRGYRRIQSAVNVNRLLAWCGNHLSRGGADLSSLVLGRRALLCPLSPFTKLRTIMSISSFAVWRGPCVARARPSPRHPPAKCSVEQAHLYACTRFQRELGWDLITPFRPGTGPLSRDSETLHRVHGPDHGASRPRGEGR